MWQLENPKDIYYGTFKIKFVNWQNLVTKENIMYKMNLKKYWMKNVHTPCYETF